MTSNKEPVDIDNQSNHENFEPEFYEDDQIPSLDAPVPFWLKFNYVFWIIFGITWFILFWNGSTVSFFDRGYWHELQEAANTTFPSVHEDMGSNPRNPR